MSDNHLKYCASECRACPQRAFTREQSAQQKTTWLQKALEPWAKLIKTLKDFPQKRWGYRNKVCLRAQYEGQWKLGLTCREEIIEIPSCPIHAPTINEFASELKKILPPYDEFPLAYLHFAQAQITFILKTKKCPEFKFLEPLFSKAKELGFEGIWFHLNPVCGMNVFMGKNWKLIWGQERSLNQEGLSYGPASFSQLIPELHHESLDEAYNYFSLKPQDKIVDLYSGNGSSLRKWIEAQAQVLGIEIVGEAIECAKLNVPEASVLRGLAKDRLPQIESFIENDSFYLYANPPRTGLEPEILVWLKAHPPKKIAYLSCSAGTLRRDLEALQTVLEVESLQPYDFFPGTRHVETLVLLKEKNMAEKTCPKCGKKFECTHDAHCWCMTLVLSPENLKRLKSEYSDCLCEACLKTYAEEKR